MEDADFLLTETITGRSDTERILIKTVKKYPDVKPDTTIANWSGDYKMKNEETGKKISFDVSSLHNKSFGEGANIPRRLGFYQCIWIKNGCGNFVVDLQEYKLEKNTMYILTPGQIHCFGAMGEIDGYCISFSEEFLIMAGGNFDLSFGMERQGGGEDIPVIQVDEEMQAEMEEIVLKMMKESSNYFRLKSEILMGLLKIFIIYFSRKVVLKEQETAQHHDMLLMRRFKHLLEENFITKKSVADYASELSVSPNYLSGKIKTVSGYSASYHIQQRIVLEAKRQAMFSGGSLKEVAYYLGFEDTSHFSKFFKNKSGVNFTDFKKAMC